MSFVNTVDIIGDNALIDSIICRTIEEIADNMIMNIGGYAFYGCSGLTTADFPAVTNIGANAFYGCSSLTTAYFPVATNIGAYAFNSCTSLTTADFPAVTNIGANAFYGCSGLTTANFHAATSIGNYAFQSCSSLTTAYFPVATNIGGYAFYGCTSLTTADFPAVTNIVAYVFDRCSKLKALILRSEMMVTLGSKTALSNTPIASGTGYIYVPRALVDSYKAATNWSTYANQFRALEDYTVDGTTTGELDPTKT